MTIFDSNEKFFLYIYLTARQLSMVYLMLKFDLSVKVFFPVYLFNDISTPYGLFNAEFLFVCKNLVFFICLTAYQHIEGYLMPKFDYFQKVWL